MPKGGSSSRWGRPSAASTTWTRTGSGNSTPVRGVCRSTWSSVSSGTSVEGSIRTDCLATWPAGSGKPTGASPRPPWSASRGTSGSTPHPSPCCTGTPTGSNVVWSGSVAQLVDWEDVRLGDPAEEVAFVFTENQLPEAGRARFWEGYARTRGHRAGPRGTTRGDLGAGHDVWVGDVVVRPLLAASFEHVALASRTP